MRRDEPVDTEMTVRLVGPRGNTLGQVRLGVQHLVFLGALLALVVSLFLVLVPRVGRSLEEGTALQAQLASATDELSTVSASVADLEPLRETLIRWHDRLQFTTPNVFTDPPTMSQGLRSLDELLELGTEFSLPEFTSRLREWITDLDETAEAYVTLQEVLDQVPNLWPIANGRGWVTFEFGPAIHPTTGTWYIHKGIDIGGIRGWPVVAMARGTVVRTDQSPFNYGLQVVVDHPNGIQTRYAHLDDVAVKVGDRVSPGQKIGELGSTGLVTGPALHLEVSIGGVAQDPAVFLNMTNDFARRVGNRQ